MAMGRVAVTGSSQPRPIAPPGRASSAVFHAIWHIKNRLFGPDGVANPRDSTRYRCGLHLARTKKPSFFMGASKRETLHY
jgi:hypothetical protein